MEELQFAFQEEVRDGGAMGVVESLTKFATWFAAVDKSDDKQISRTELYQFMMENITVYGIINLHDFTNVVPDMYVYETCKCHCSISTMQ